MTNEEMSDLVQKYFQAEGYVFPGDFEHRVESISSAMVYSLVRHYRPKNVLEVGSWHGGITCILMTALQKNNQLFHFVCSELADDNREKTRSNVLRACGQEPIMVGDITESLSLLPPSLDFVFIDTDHDEGTTNWIIDHIWPRITKNGIYGMHDWAVYEEGEKAIGKGNGGVGGWPEATYLINLHNEKKFPFQKLFWTYRNPGSEETGFWIHV